MATPLTNAFGVGAGSVVTEFRLDEASNNTRTAFQSMLRIAGLALLPALLILALYGLLASKSNATFLISSGNTALYRGAHRFVVGTAMPATFLRGSPKG
jgi:hypothetical protein